MSRVCLLYHHHHHHPATQGTLQHSTPPIYPPVTASAQAEQYAPHMPIVVSGDISTHHAMHRTTRHTPHAMQHASSHTPHTTHHTPCLKPCTTRHTPCTMHYARHTPCTSHTPHTTHLTHTCVTPPPPSPPQHQLTKMNIKARWRGDALLQADSTSTPTSTAIGRGSNLGVSIHHAAERSSKSNPQGWAERG